MFNAYDRMLIDYVLNRWMFGSYKLCLRVICCLGRHVCLEVVLFLPFLIFPLKNNFMVHYDTIYLLGRLMKFMMLPWSILLGFCKGESTRGRKRSIERRFNKESECVSGNRQNKFLSAFQVRLWDSLFQTRWWGQDPHFIQRCFIWILKLMVFSAEDRKSKSGLELFIGLIDG